MQGKSITDVEDVPLERIGDRQHERERARRWSGLPRQRREGAALRIASATPRSRPGKQLDRGSGEQKHHAERRYSDAFTTTAQIILSPRGM